MRLSAPALGLILAAFAAPALAEPCSPQQTQDVGAQMGRTARDHVHPIAPVQGKQIFNVEKCEFGRVSKTITATGKYSYLGDGGLYWVTLAVEQKDGADMAVKFTGMSKNLGEAVRAQQSAAPAILVAALP